jgi:hypothetical protein
MGLLNAIAWWLYGRYSLGSLQDGDGRMRICHLWPFTTCCRLFARDHYQEPGTLDCLAYRTCYHGILPIIHFNTDLSHILSFLSREWGQAASKHVLGICIPHPPHPPDR